MSNTTSTRNDIDRKKDHKGGKVASLGILWGAVGLVIILGVTQLVAVYINDKPQEYDRDVVAVTEVTQGDKLQPMASKIVASDDMEMISSEKAAVPSDYADVWLKLERLAPETATDEVRVLTIQTFLAGLNYRMSERTGTIISITTGDTISPSTLTCYLNGYIPDKPYIKTNCPSS